MKKITIGIVIFICVLISASLLKGAGVGFNFWYGAPEAISRFAVTIITMVGLTRGCLFLVERFFRKD